MAKPVFALVHRPRQIIYGTSALSNVKKQAKDIPALSARYRKLSGQPQNTVPFFVVSTGYQPASGDFSLFVGGDMPREGLQAFTLPAGTYGHVVIRPKLGFAWGAAIGEAKRAFYTEWLPASGYKALNIEYEHHTNTSLGKHPTLELLFAVGKEVENQ